MKKQREDYEQAMSTIDQLSGANAKTLSELESLQREKENGQRKTAQLSRENLRFRQETKDLCLQVDTGYTVFDPVCPLSSLEIFTATVEKGRLPKLLILG